MALQQTVFLVDDDPAIRRSLSYALQKRGFTVDAYASGQAFLDSYQPEKAGCLILDLSMPGMNGLELQEHLIERDSRLPIIFITGHGSIPQSVHALKAGAVDFLEKPFRQEILLARIDDAFAEDRRRRQAFQERCDIAQRIDRLTEREKEIMQLLVSRTANHSSKDLARELDISNRTVDHHRARVMEKMEARSLPELIGMVTKWKASLSVDVVGPDQVSH